MERTLRQIVLEREIPPSQYKKLLVALEKRYVNVSLDKRAVCGLIGETATYTEAESLVDEICAKPCLDEISIREGKFEEGKRTPWYKLAMRAIRKNPQARLNVTHMLERHLTDPNMYFELKTARMDYLSSKLCFYQGWQGSSPVFFCGVVNISADDHTLIEVGNLWGKGRHYRGIVDPSRFSAP